MGLPSEYDSRFWLAVLREIAQAGGQAKPATIYPKMRAYFPEITDQDMRVTNGTGGNKWTNMIQWARQHLVYRGCIDNAQPGTWILTELGRQWLEDNWRSLDADYSQVKKPPLLKKPSAKKSATDGNGATAAKRRVRSASLSRVEKPTDPSTTVGNEPLPTPAASQLQAIHDPAQLLIQRIQATQRQSQIPQQFELALTEALSFLGFEAMHIGGAGDTDIFAAASLGQASYSIVVDAKSTHTGKVTDGQINWPSIVNHRQAREATFAAVIGEDFSSGQVQKVADQYKVTLITTQLLCDLIRLHASAPFNLHDLKDLFSASGRADDSVQMLRERHNRNQRHWLLISDIIDTVEKFQRRTPTSPAPKAENLHFHLALNGSHAPVEAPTSEEVSDAVAFLASRAANILVEVPGSSGAYQLAMQGSMARKRLMALARFFDGAKTARGVSVIDVNPQSAV